MSEYSTLKLEIDGPIARLTLNRPDAGNAFSDVMHREFSEVLEALSTMDALRVVLLTASGRIFSAGGDFAYIRKLRAEHELRDRAFGEGMGIFERLVNMPVPIVTAAHGHAIGLGATILSLSDISVAWKDAKIGDPHVRVGLVAGDGGVIGWASAIGFNRARRYLLTGDTLTGTDAHALGLVTDLADTPEATINLAESLAQQIAALPPLAVRGTKLAFNALSEVRTGDAQLRGFAAEHDVLMSEDVEEAIRAIEEKRPPNFSGR